VERGNEISSPYEIRMRFFTFNPNIICMKYLKLLFRIIGLMLVVFIVFLAFATIDNYNPDPETIVYESEDPRAVYDSVFSMVTWNIGYAGLDSTMDFFYDGGEKVRPDQSEVRRNVKEIIFTLDDFRDRDFLLLQEVDKNSKRSYRENIYEIIAGMLRDHHSVFGINYDVAFVPLPPTEPMGKVLSGLQTLSLPEPARVERYSFPGNYSWPMSVFMLDRCFLVNRYMVPGGNQLVVINTHNSAYDDGTLRSQQMDFLKEFILGEYEEGNYVVVGGDWNQSPADFAPGFSGDLFDTDNLTYIEKGYPALDWTWAYDPSIPTNRRVLTPYRRGTSPTTVIDFFLLSPNLELLEVSGVDLQFAYSDHQPVAMKFRIQ